MSHDDSYTFVDLVSGLDATVHLGDHPGVAHSGCDHRAEVAPTLDAFYCTHCGHSGRISGVWFLEMFARHYARQVTS